MIVVPEYRGFRIEVNAIAVDGRHNAEGRILRLFACDKPHAETVRRLDGDERSQVLTAACQTMKHS